jgi:hypothetical protein
LEINMTFRKKLGSGFETLELRAAPSTLLGTGIPLDSVWHGAGPESKYEAPSYGMKPIESGFVSKPTPGSDGKSDGQTPGELAAHTQSMLDAMFAARAAARNGLADGAGQHPGARSVDKGAAEVRDFATGEHVIEGASSSLRRTPKGVSWTLKTSELEAGHVYTLWVAVFNNPDACVDGCGVDDLFRPEVAATVAYGGGHVVGPNGNATFSGHLQEGDTSGFPQDSPFVGRVGGEDLGLVDASQAVIHLVIRDHGEKIPGRVDEQIGSFSGACDVNACANVQFAAHHP